MYQGNSGYWYWTYYTLPEWIFYLFILSFTVCMLLTIDIVYKYWRLKCH